MSKQSKNIRIDADLIRFWAEQFPELSETGAVAMGLRAGKSWIDFQSTARIVESGGRPRVVHRRPTDLPLHSVTIGKRRNAG